MNSNVCQNGRVDILGSQALNQFDLYDKIPVRDCPSYRSAMVGNWIPSDLSRSFFSEKNIQIIQNGIRAGVYNASNKQYVIGPQDCDALSIIMRSIFLQHSANMPCQITQQIEALNKLVLDYCIPQVYGEAQGYIKYKHDVSTLAVPMSRPAAASYKTKTLELKPFF